MALQHDELQAVKDRTRSGTVDRKQAKKLEKLEKQALYKNQGNLHYQAGLYVKAIKRYEEANRIYGSGFDQGVDMFVHRTQRTESAFDEQIKLPGDVGWQKKRPTFRDSSLVQWVYVTSSDDPDIEPGMWRLIDLKAWPDRPCHLNREQPCLGVNTIATDPSLSNQYRPVTRRRAESKRRRLFYWAIASFIAASSSINPS